jgi:hypothetical protein
MDIDFESFEEIYKVDENKQVNGVDVEFGLNKKNDPITMIVAEIGNPNNRKVMRKYEKALETSRNNKKKRSHIWAKIVAESILIGWRGVLDSKGKEVKPTLDNKVASLVKYEKLFVDIMEAAQDGERFRPDDDINASEESEKNLRDISDGT